MMHFSTKPRLIFAKYRIAFAVLLWFPVALCVGPTLKIDTGGRASKNANVAILEELRTITDLILRTQQTVDPEKSIPVIHDCTTLREAGIKANGVYVVFPFTFKVYSDMLTDGGGWTVVQRRAPIDVHENFNRPWSDYKFGFGDLYTEFWLGLEALHQLTYSGLFELRIDMVDYESGPRHAHYQMISVGPESDGYRLRVSNYSGDAGDALSTFHSGRRFSTYDSDHDVSRNKSCAQEKGGGWWFHACYAAHLNGIYPEKPKRNSSSSQIRWWSNREHVLVLTSVEMKIRRKTESSKTSVHSSAEDEDQNNEVEGQSKKVEDQDKEESSMDYEFDMNITEDTHHQGRSDVSPWGIINPAGYD